MKIVCIGNLFGEIDIINEYIEEANADIALLMGNIGIFYRNKDKNLPKSFVDNQFYKYLEGRVRFTAPVFTIRGPHDNFDLAEKIEDQDIVIDNFHVIRNGEVVYYDGVNIGGVGGAYSPVAYELDKLTGVYKRNFNKKQFSALMGKKVDILLLHDVMGDCSKKRINFSDSFLECIASCRPFYTLVGRFGWWAHAQLQYGNCLVFPNAKDGYVILDTETWDAEGVEKGKDE